MLLALVLFCPFFSFLNLDNVSLLSLAPTSGASTANSSAAANATVLALFSAGAAGLGYYLLRRGRGGSVSFASQQNFSALNSIKSSIGSAIDGIKNFLVKNSDAIKTGSDIAGWASLGLFIAGAILSLTGVGAVVGVPLMAAAFAVGAGSAVADLAVGAARQSAGVADADDYIRMGLAPLAIIPIGRVATQPGKMVAKQAGKQIIASAGKGSAKRIISASAKNVGMRFTRPELNVYQKWVNGLYRYYGGKKAIKVVSKPASWEGWGKYEAAPAQVDIKEKKIYLNRAYVQFIKKDWKSVLRHEANHLNVRLQKFQEEFLSNSLRRGEIQHLLNNENMEEAAVDLISAYQSKIYGEDVLRWGEEIGKTSAGVQTGKPLAATNSLIQWARRKGFIGIESDFRELKWRTIERGHKAPAVLLPLPYLKSTKNSSINNEDNFSRKRTNTIISQTMRLSTGLSRRLNSIPAKSAGAARRSLAHKSRGFNVRYQHKCRGRVNR